MSIGMHSAVRLTAGWWFVLCFAAVGHGQAAAGEDWKSEWTSAAEANRDIAHYFDQRAREKVTQLRGKHSPKEFCENVETIRKSLAAAYLMPKVAWDGQSQLVRESTIDGIAVEVRVLRVLPGVYSTLRIYRPPAAGGGRQPAFLYLPGHGDPAWHPVLQKRVLGFAKQGFVAAVPDPFGQDELTDTPGWNEYHGCGAMAYLLTTGQSLLGVIMASHSVELSYLGSRNDVDASRVAVMGGSMGGTHTLWLTAIDERVKAAVAVSAAPTVDPCWNLRMHCLCDSMVRTYAVADGEIVRALIAPRPLLVIYPDLEAPLNNEGSMLLSEGKLDFMDKAAKSKYFLTAQQMAAIYPFARAVYERQGAAGRFQEIVVEGPHGDAQQYRELAYGWLAHFLMGRPTAGAMAEPLLSPLEDPASARNALMAWPEGRRPSDFVGPTEYTKRAVSLQVTRLPKPPTSAEEAGRLGTTLRQRVSDLLGARLVPGRAIVSRLGELSVDGVTASRLEIQPEPGAVVHALVFRPEPGVRPKDRVYVLLDPEGVRATAASKARKDLTESGSWAVCADLRGMGSTYATQAAYVGIRDQPLCVGAMKLGETVAGWWTDDLLAVVHAARTVAGAKAEVIVRGRRETGLVAILAAALGQGIDAVEAEETLASYRSSSGYGFPYVYGDAGGHNAKLGVYGSMLPCIPSILTVADLPQIDALVCPKPLTIVNPLWATGERLSPHDVEAAFAWTTQYYRVSDCGDRLFVGAGPR